MMAGMVGAGEAPINHNAAQLKEMAAVGQAAAVVAAPKPLSKKKIKLSKQADKVQEFSEAMEWCNSDEPFFDYCATCDGTGKRLYFGRDWHHRPEKPDQTERDLCTAAFWKVAPADRTAFTVVLFAADLSADAAPWYCNGEAERTTTAACRQIAEDGKDRWPLVKPTALWNRLIGAVDSGNLHSTLSIGRDYEISNFITWLQNNGATKNHQSRDKQRAWWRKALGNRKAQCLDTLRMTANTGRGGHRKPGYQPIQLVELNEAELAVLSSTNLPDNNWFLRFFKQHDHAVREKPEVTTDQSRAQAATVSTAASHLCDLLVSLTTLPVADTVVLKSEATDEFWVTSLSDLGVTVEDKDLIASDLFSFMRPVITGCDQWKLLGAGVSIDLFGRDITVLATVNGNGQRENECRVNSVAELTQWWEQRTVSELQSVALTCALRCAPDTAIIHPDTGHFNSGDPELLSILREAEADLAKAEEAVEVALAAAIDGVPAQQRRHGAAVTLPQPVHASLDRLRAVASDCRDQVTEADQENQRRGRWRLDNHNEMPQGISYAGDVGNCREQMACGVEDGKTVNTPENARPPNRDQVTIHEMCNAAGVFGPWHLIQAGANLMESHAPECVVYASAGVLSVTECGQQTGVSLLAYLKHFNSWLGQERKSAFTKLHDGNWTVTKPVMIVADGHASRYDEHVLSFCRENQLMSYIEPRGNRLDSCRCWTRFSSVSMASTRRGRGS